MSKLKARTAYSIAIEEKDLESSGTTLVYFKSEADKVIAEKDAEIRRLKRSLYKACANWADVVAFENTEGIGYDNSVAERWRKMASKCLKKAAGEVW